MFAVKLVSSVSVAALMLALSPVANAVEPQPKPKTLVFAGNECLFTGEQQPDGQALLGAILAVIAPILVEMAVDGLVADLQKVRTVKSAGSLDLDLWGRVKAPNSSGELVYTDQLRQNLPRCLTSVTGHFEKAESRFVDNLVSSRSIGVGATEADYIARLADNNIKVTKIYHVFETKLEPSSDNTAFRLKPDLVRSFGLLPGNGSGKQGLAYTVTLRGPGGSPWGTTYALAPISLGETDGKINLHLRSEEQEDRTKLDALKTGLITAPGMSDDAYRAYMRDRKRMEIESFMPANLHVEVVQTKKPSDAELFVAKILEKAKPKIVASVASAVDPDGPFNSGQAKLDAEIAKLKAEKALEDARNLPNPDAKQIAILEKELEKANAKLAKIDDD